MGVCICGLVQPPAPPQRDQIRDAPPAPQWSRHGYLPAASGGLRGRPPCQSNALERCHPLLESAGRSVDKQATGRARTGPGVTIDSCRLNGSQGVTTFLKVTGRHQLLHHQKEAIFHPLRAAHAAANQPPTQDAGPAAFAAWWIPLHFVLRSHTTENSLAQTAGEEPRRDAIRKQPSASRHTATSDLPSLAAILRSR